jgi:hypothetical protein
LLHRTVGRTPPPVHLRAVDASARRSFVMASNRKLQGEIDRVLKQIGEHMQEFDQIWSEHTDTI